LWYLLLVTLLTSFCLACFSSFMLFLLLYIPLLLCRNASPPFRCLVVLLSCAWKMMIVWIANAWKLV
jgi:hypothetical protein